MAITKILNIKESKGRNPASHLENALRYIQNPDKTEECVLVGSINCLPDTAFEQMVETKNIFHKTGNRQGYHVIISFSPEEKVSAEQAMYVLEHFAKDVLGDDYEAVFAVHTDREHMHGHLIWNSVSVGNIWGDYARTIIVENGMVVEDIGLIENPEWKSGLQMEEKLHAELLRFATKETTFEKLYYHMNEFIVENGFVNLDFMGNLGHSIVKTKGDRVYIEKGNMTKLGDVKYFTFEPHIAFPDSKYGYKKENIYYFNENGLMEL